MNRPARNCAVGPPAVRGIISSGAARRPPYRRPRLAKAGVATTRGYIVVDDQLAPACRHLGVATHARAPSLYRFHERRSSPRIASTARAASETCITTLRSTRPRRTRPPCRSDVRRAPAGLIGIRAHGRTSSAPSSKARPRLIKFVVVPRPADPRAAVSHRRRRDHPLDPRRPPKAPTQ